MKRGKVPLPFNEWQEKIKILDAKIWRELVYEWFMDKKYPRERYGKIVDKWLRLKIVVQELTKLLDEIGDRELKESIEEVILLVDAKAETFRKILESED